MLAVDTNLLVRLVTEDDLPQTVRATAVFETEQVWIAKTVLLETERVLRSGYKFQPAAIQAALTQLLLLPGVEVEDPSAVEIALDLFREGMDFADALHVASRPANATFVTFDESLVRQAKGAGLHKVQEPERARRPRH